MGFGVSPDAPPGAAALLSLPRAGCALAVLEGPQWKGVPSVALSSRVLAGGVGQASQGG